VDALLTPVFAGFGIGIALGGAPGPVQAVLLTESTRGLGRGFRAMVGANLTFGVLLVAGAVGFSAIVIGASWLRVLDLAAGLMLLGLAFDGLRTSLHARQPDGPQKITVPPFVRGASVVLLNPGGWLFLATVGTSLFAAARLTGGRPIAVASALAMIAGLALGDGAVVLVGSLGLRRAGLRVRLWVQRALAALLGGLGCWLLLMALIKP
jgi:threonine/homoserine/homoserine lactone efflux protein